MKASNFPVQLLLCTLVFAAIAGAARADGKVFAPVEYKGSLQERAQEAILLFHPGDEKTSATEDMILKIKVDGDVRNFAWVVPLPSEPTTGQEDAKLFEELHAYVQAQLAAQRSRARGAESKSEEPIKSPAPAGAAPVEVLSRKVVGSYDVATVRENEPGALVAWLKENGYHPPEDPDDVIGFYRKKKCVFACVKVTDVEAAKGQQAELHPLRFSFKTGGRDGIFFPMRMTGLQTEPFSVNLYVLYGKWLNDHLNGFGYFHRGLGLVWRDYDGPQCQPNAGKRWSDPSGDPYLSEFSYLIPTVAKLVQRLHPGARYYLTNLAAADLRPAEVRSWSDDLWLFPYYSDPKFVPHDARPGGPAALGYPNADRGAFSPPPETQVQPRQRYVSVSVRWPWIVSLAVIAVVIGTSAAWPAWRARQVGVSKPKTARDAEL